MMQWPHKILNVNSVSQVTFYISLNRLYSFSHKIAILFLQVAVFNEMSIKLTEDEAESQMWLPFFSFCSRSHNALLAAGSNPEVGSSSRTTREEPHIAAPTDSRRFWPPDKFADTTFLWRQ